ncbi:MAG: RNA-binding domain-containing protein [Candidatus Hydrothermarchaeales archaeon]
MNIEEVVGQKESETLEFKKSLQLKDEIGEAISAFSNAHGGTIVVGVSDPGKILGINVGENTLEELANYVKRNTDNQVFPSIIVEKVGDKDIVVVEVSESSEKPVFFKGKAFKRVGKSKHRLSASEIRALAKESTKAYWDEQVCEGAGLEDIDEEKVRWFVKEAKRQRGLKLSAELPIKEILTRLKLLRNGKLTHATLLLFSEEPMFLQCEIKCIRFSGNEPVKPYIDFASMEGTVFDLVNGAEDFVLRNIRKAIWLVPEQIQREEKYEYPPNAIREAIVNAVVHRDYESPSKVQVRIFDNRIEVWSPGLLPEGITVEDLKREHRSIPRNPLLFKQLFWVKYVEDVGGGTLDMISLCREWEILEPDFKHITGALVVIFRLPPFLEDLEKLGLNKRQIKAVEYVKKSGSITSGEYQKLNNTTRYTAARDLAKLVKLGIFTRVGRGKRELRYILLSMQNASKKRQKMRQS